jgi:hypothetical protein
VSYHRRSVVNQPDGIGCRDAALATVFLLGFGIAQFAIGLTLINREVCTGWCETTGLTLLYSGGPISALFGVFTDHVIIAWPLDITLWVVLGFAVARYADRRGNRPLGTALLVIVMFLGLGLVLSQFVELAR